MSREQWYQVAAGFGTSVAAVLVAMYAAKYVTALKLKD